MNTHPIKPKPLGYRARAMIQDVDIELASAYRKLAPASEGVPLQVPEVKLVATQVRGHLSEARRMVTEIEHLGE